MANITSSFLQGVNGASSATSAVSSEFSEDSVLAAIKSTQVNDLDQLAAALDTGKNRVRPTVENLQREGLVSLDGERVALSESGERFLRYKTIARS